MARHPDGTIRLRRAVDLLRHDAREQAEQWLDATTALETALDQYQQLFNDAPIGYVVLDDHGVMVDINKQAAALLNASVGQLTGRPLALFVFRNDIKLFRWHLRLCASGGGSTELRLTARGQGGPRPVRLISRRASLPSQPRLHYTIIHDTADEHRHARALRQSEKRYREIVETANEGICILDNENRIVFANRRLGLMVGFPSETLVGKPSHDFLSDRSAGNILVHAGRSRSGESEQQLRCADGSILPVSVSVTEMRDEHGRVSGFLRMYTDATAGHDLMRAREELVRKMVAAQEGERQRIARELHDQLGQHIVGLSLGLARLATLCTEQESAELIALMRRSADLLAKDVHTLAIELRPSTLDHLGIAEAIRAYAEDIAQRTGLDIDFHCDAIDDSKLEAAVQTGLYRIAQEALTNIVKHARARHVSVLLERHVDALQLIIEDDGRGFEPDKLNRVNGGRLGLDGMRERAALIGGTLTIESALRQGTTIYVRIPLTPRPNEDEQKTSTAAR